MITEGILVLDRFFAEYTVRVEEGENDKFNVKEISIHTDKKEGRKKAKQFVRATYERQLIPFYKKEFYDDGTYTEGKFGWKSSMGGILSHYREDAAIVVCRAPDTSDLSIVGFWKVEDQFFPIIGRKEEMTYPSDVEKIVKMVLEKMQDEENIILMTNMLMRDIAYLDQPDVENQGAFEGANNLRAIRISDSIHFYDEVSSFVYEFFYSCVSQEDKLTAREVIRKHLILLKEEIIYLLDKIIRKLEVKKNESEENGKSQ